MAEVMASAKVLLIATAFAALLTADVRAQISNPIPPAGATATISGRVSDVRTEAAVPAATLTLFDEQQRREIGTTADAEGHFRFENIHRGDYALLASHADYVEQLLLVDVRGTLRPARIVVAGGEHIQGIEIKLTRAAHILGRITDEDGHPIEYASVRAIVVRPTQLEGLRSVDANTTTDANGNYRLTLVPGAEYVLQASATRTRGSIIGQPLRETPAEYERRWYPGVVQQKDAAYVRTSSGEVISNVNIALRTIRFFTITGQVVGTSVLPEKFEVILAGSTSGSTARPSRLVKADGGFTYERLTPGRYVLWSRAAIDSGDVAAWMPIDLDRNIDGVRLELMPTGRIVGRVVTERGDPLPIEGFRIAAPLLDNDIDIDLRSIDQTEVAVDGSFTIERVFGDRSLRVFGLPAGWAQIHVEVGRSRVPRLSISPGTQHDVIVVIGRR